MWSDSKQNETQEKDGMYMYVKNLHVEHCQISWALYCIALCLAHAKQQCIDVKVFFLSLMYFYAWMSFEW